MFIITLMQELVKQIHRTLVKNKKTVALAESCTGGLLSSLLTSLSGSSQYFILGAVVYSNFSKSLLLKIPLALIKKNGAVSRVVAQKMAAAIRKLAKTDFAIAITGIAGPTGGTIDKPVGTVFIALSSQHQQLCSRFNFKGNRTSIRKQAALKALQLLKNILIVR